MAERTDKDYAIEHAGYMATAARAFMAAVNAETTARMDDEEHGTERSGEELALAMSEVSEACSALSNAIYEFEKRRDRAARGVQGGYLDAFYEMAAMLGIEGAQAKSPEQVYREQIKPALEALKVGAADGVDLPDGEQHG